MTGLNILYKSQVMKLLITINLMKSHKSTYIFLYSIVEIILKCVIIVS